MAAKKRTRRVRSPKTLAGVVSGGVMQKYLEGEVARLKAENQVWRNLMAEFRELVTEVHQVLPFNTKYDRIRKCIADPKVMDAEVQKILAGQGATK